MKWPWTRTKSAQEPTAPNNDLPDVAELVAIADGFRDARNWPQAVGAYERVLARFPESAAIWVQFGHARKETGDLAGAESAYRRALEIDPDNADSLVQIGHALKLQGRRDAAIAAYAQALRADRTCDPALRELIALGEGPIAGQVSGLGDLSLHNMLGLITEMRRGLDTLERMLPDVASLASIASGRYDLFRQTYRLPNPPEPLAERSWAVLVIAGASDCGPTLRSLADQTKVPARIVVQDASAAAIGRAEQSGYFGNRNNVQFLAAGQAPEPDGMDWVLVVDCGVELASTALAWLDWAAENCTADAIYADEFWQGNSITGPAPSFKATDDPFTDATLYDHTILAVRASTLVQISRTAPIAIIEAVTAGGGRVAHLARVLSRRPGAPYPPQSRTRAALLRGLPGRVSAIIPTRDGCDMLRKCVTALRELASRPEDVDIIILDNGSITEIMLKYLSELANLPRVQIHRVDERFNWSRLNNLGVTQSIADVVLFINDDVEVTVAGWDDILRATLALHDVGAVGARLNYPNGCLQHAGIVFGPSGRCEHEGVGYGAFLTPIAERWTSRRQVGAVTGAFLACCRTIFDRVGGFDPSLPIWFNDVDFCLTLRQAGLAIIYEPDLTAIHRESPTLAVGAADPDRRVIWDTSLAEMRRRWGEALTIDPGFNPHFARTGRPFEALFEPSLGAVQAHLKRSAQPNPWRVP